MIKNPYSIFQKLSLIIFFIISGCCNEDLTGSYELSDYSKSLVPFVDYNELNYTNELDQRKVATTQTRTIETKTDKPGPESCQYSKYETLSNFINFQNPEFSIQIDMSSNNGKETFGIRYLEVGNNNSIENLNLENYNISMDEFKEAKKDTTILDFTFNDVYIFSNEENSNIKTIVFSSSGRGIEFIEFTDGSFLKLE